MSIAGGTDGMDRMGGADGTGIANRKNRAEGRTAALHNLGCKVNGYETEAMEQLLEKAGYTIVPFSSKADVYVINTCSVTNIADRKSRQMLSRARKQNPDAVVVAAGCYVQTAHDTTHLDVDADILLGNNRKTELVGVLDEWFARKEGVRGEDSRENSAQKSGTPEKGRQKSGVRESGTGERGAQESRIEDISHERGYENMGISRTGGRTRAFVKVQDGCSQFCSYCVIPYARGRVRSRDAGDVTEEVRALTESGVREVVLTGIHLSSYGLDNGYRPGDGEALLGLIRAVAGVPGVERIRLGSLEPRIITEEFAAGLKQVAQLCPHFHLSLQSGCDSVLKRMNRKYTAGEYEAACAILRRTFDRPALTTDVIVGFPGETGEEFAATKAFLTGLKLYETHIFRYSRREGTRAAAMPEQIPESVKMARSDELIRLGKENALAFIRAWDGTPAQVLFEEETEVDGERAFTGYTREYIRVYARSETDLRGQVAVGRLDCLRPEQVRMEIRQTTMPAENAGE